MSNAVVERASNGRLQVSIPSDTTGLSSRVMDIRGFRSGHVLIPAAWTAADLAFLSADVDDDAAVLRSSTTPTPAGLSGATPITYTLISRDTASAALLRVTNIPTASSRWMPLPAALFYGHAFIKPFSVNTASEAAVDQAAARTLLFRFSS